MQDGTLIIRTIKKEARNFEKLAETTVAEPKPKYIHALRVTTRKLRTHLSLSEEAQKTDTVRKVKKRLRGIADVLGEVRKYDVAIDDAKRFQLKTKKLKNWRKKAADDVSKTLKPKTVKKTLKSLETWLKRVEKGPAQQVKSSAALLQTKLKAWQESPPTSNKEWHELRLLIKKTRYFLGSTGTSRPLLEQLQDALGKKHDLEVLKELVGEKSALTKAENRETEVAKSLLKRALADADAALERVAR